MTVGAMLAEAVSVAVRNGHKPRNWTHGQKSTGPFASMVCAICGSMVIAEYTEQGVLVRGGGTQYLSCLSAQQKKRRAVERRLGR